MASPKPYASVCEESSDVQVLDSIEPLVMASSSVASSSSARVLDSIEPLVPTSARVQVLDSDEPLVLQFVRSSVPDDPVAGPSGLVASASSYSDEFGNEPVAGPSGRAAAASPSGSLPQAHSDDDEDDEILAAAMPRPTGSSGRRMNPYSDELRSMWNWRKINSRLGSNEQCVEFAEERGLIAKEKMCSYHRKPMMLTTQPGKVGKFRCRKTNCRTKLVSRAKGTWFEQARLSLTLIFQMMYAFSEGLTYHQTRKELAVESEPVVSARTVADWFNYCRETIAIYELENQRAQGKIGGPNKVVQIDKSKFGKRKYNRGRQIEGHWVIGMIEDGSDDLRLEVCPDNERTAAILVPLIQKHVQEGSIIHTDYWRAYLSLPEHGYTHKRVNHSDPVNKFVAPDGTHTQRIESQWRGLKKCFRQKQHKHNFTDWLCEYSWRRRNMINHLDPFEELILAIKYVYKLD